MAVGGGVVSIEGLPGFVKQLRALDKDIAKEFGMAMKLLAEESAIDARGAAQGGTRQQAVSAYNIVGSGSRAAGSIQVTSGNALPQALGAFWGSKRPQFPGLPWVGKSWQAGVHGQGPYFINDALADDADMLEKEFPLLIEKYARKAAFPD